MTSEACFQMHTAPPHVLSGVNSAERSLTQEGKDYEPKKIRSKQAFIKKEKRKFIDKHISKSEMTLYSVNLAQDSL